MAGSFRFQSGRIPAYTHHKPTGQARVRVDGRDYYLGKYGSVESRRKYGELIAKLASGLNIDGERAKAGATVEPGQFTVNELCLAFMRHAATHYVKDGQQTDEIDCLKSAIRSLVELYGHEFVNRFGSLALKAVRANYVGKGWCRKYVNSSVNRVRRIFRWGVENELVEPTTLQKLEAVSPLLAGRTEAPDYAPRHPVPKEQVDAVRDVLSQCHRDLIDLQLLTGTRSGELLKLTTGMIDRSGDIWTARIAIETVAADLVTRYPGVFFVTLHDAIYTTAEHLPKVEQAFQRAFAESGFSMALKIEGGKSQSIISPKVREGGSAVESKPHSNSGRA